MFKLYTKENAPKDSKHLIEKTIKTYGFLPNLFAILAESALAYEAYSTMFELFEKQSHFTALEQQIIFQTSNFENQCNYCTPAHSMVMTLMKMPEEIIEALREGFPIQDTKLQTLREFTKELIINRGHISQNTYDSFRQAGYTNQHALEVLIALGTKLISNFTNSMAKTPVDEPMKSFTWTHPTKRQGSDL